MTGKLSDSMPALWLRVPGYRRCCCNFKFREAPLRRACKLVIREIRFQLWNKINKLLSTIHPIVTSCVLIDAVDVCVIMHSSFQGLSWERLYHILPQDWITCSLSAVFANSPIVICHCNLYLLFRNLHRSYRLYKDHSFRPCRLGTYVKP